MGRWTHEWDVVGVAGASRFVESDEFGVPANPKLYKQLRKAEARGELAYQGLRESAADSEHTANLDGPGRSNRREGSYGEALLDSASASGLSLGGDMALYRDN